MKLQVFQTALRAIYPPQCILCRTGLDRDNSLCGPCWRAMPFIDGPVCDCCGTPILTAGFAAANDICQTCQSHPRPWGRGRAALLYQGSARRLVLSFKHGDRPDIATGAAQWMARAARDLVGPDTVLVPIPLHWRRRLARRYNQADILAHEAASLIGAKVASDVLVRPRPTVPLEIASAAERYDRLRDAFALTGRAAQKLAGRSVILVDDVMTSGATLTAAAQTLQSAQPQKIDCLVLARVPQNDYIGGEEKD